MQTARPLSDRATAYPPAGLTAGSLSGASGPRRVPRHNLAAAALGTALLLGVAGVAAWQNGQWSWPLLPTERGLDAALLASPLADPDFALLQDPRSQALLEDLEFYLWLEQDDEE